MRNILDSKGAALAQHSSRPVLLTFSYGLHDEPEDLAATVEISQLIVASVSSSRHELGSTEASVQFHGQISQQEGEDQLNR